MYKACACVLSANLLACFLQISSKLDRESAAEIVLCYLETSVCGIFDL